MKLEDLQGKSHEHKLRISFYSTLVAAVILVPVWLWTAGGIDSSSKSEANAQLDQNASPLQQVEEGINTTVDTLGNPVTQVDQQLQESFSAPLSVTSSETKDGRLIVYFQVKNSTFADLTVPVSRSVLSSVDTPDSVILLEKATNDEGGQFVPLIPAGETRNGILYFSQVLNGSYNIKFTGLRYDGNNQNEFEQSTSFEVTDSWKPRS